jgi:hypothetical protein
MRAKASPQDIEHVLAAVQRLWLECPHQRLGQLLINLAQVMGAHEGDTEHFLWNMDEDDILHAIKTWRESWTKES